MSTPLNQQSSSITSKVENQAQQPAILEKFEQILQVLQGDVSVHEGSNIGAIFANYFTENAEFYYPGFKTRIGRQEISNAFGDIQARCQPILLPMTVRHNIEEVWVKDNVVFAQLVNFYYQEGGSHEALRLPVFVIFKFENNLVRELRLYLDTHELLASREVELLTPSKQITHR
jgi:hypothetical protein